MSQRGFLEASGGEGRPAVTRGSPRGRVEHRPCAPGQRVAFIASCNFALVYG